MTGILIVGATSAIAEHSARLWANKTTSFFLVGRDRTKLDAIASDLAARNNAKAVCHVLDVVAVSDHAGMLDAALRELGSIDIALIAHGTLPHQAKCEVDVQTAVAEFQTNAVSTIALLTQLAATLEKQGSGSIAVISSVAGDRGRPSNYLYGAAKGAVSIFCQGLRARLHKRGINVLTIKPGFVDTPMTKGLKLPGLLLASPERIARDIVKAVGRRRSEIYTPYWWRMIMLVITLIPEPVFRRMKL